MNFNSNISWLSAPQETRGSQYLLVQQPNYSLPENFQYLNPHPQYSTGCYTVPEEPNFQEFMTDQVFLDDSRESTDFKNPDSPSRFAECSGLHSHSKKISKTRGSDSETGQKSRRIWNAQEDEHIMRLVNKLGFNWAAISKSFGGMISGKQIRDRYLNKLDPNIRNHQWSTEEDEQLIALFKLHGRSWTTIAKHLPGRTENMVKNRFYSKLKHLLADSDEGEEKSEGETVKKSRVSKAKKTDRKKVSKKNKANHMEEELPEISAQRQESYNSTFTFQEKTNQTISEGFSGQFKEEYRFFESSHKNNNLNNMQPAAIDVCDRFLNFESESFFKSVEENNIKSLEDLSTTDYSSFGNGSKSQVNSQNNVENTVLHQIEERVELLENMLNLNLFTGQWMHGIKELSQLKKDASNPDNAMFRQQCLNLVERVRGSLPKLHVLFSSSIMEINGLLHFLTEQQQE